jgi:hypothetical protein
MVSHHFFLGTNSVQSYIISDTEDPRRVSSARRTRNLAVDLSGAANVFEGTVSYSLQAPDGAELDHGFTTATQQQWSNWYAFSFTTSYPSQQHGPGHVVVWETSMKDGSRVNVYDVPVNM